jgi:DMSO reductase anchor subunit
MMVVFVLIAGSLAAGAAVLLAWPLMRRRTDSLPAAAVATAAVTLALLLGGAGLYAEPVHLGGRADRVRLACGHDCPACEATGARAG